MYFFNSSYMSYIFPAFFTIIQTVLFRKLYGLSLTIIFNYLRKYKTKLGQAECICIF